MPVSAASCARMGAPPAASQTNARASVIALERMRAAHMRASIKIAGPLLGLFDPRRRRRAFADDEQDRLFVLGAVPMHLLAVVRDESAGWHRHGGAGVELVAGSDPPRALDHRDKAIVGMKVRTAEVSRQPF